MKSPNSWIWVFKKRNAFSDGGKCGLKMKQLSFMGVVCTVMLFIVYRTTNYQYQAYQQTEMDAKWNPFDTVKDIFVTSKKLDSLPRGIVQARSDLELRPLWLTSGSRLKVDDYSQRNLLAIPVGIKQKDSVDAIVEKFLPENFTIILFHYDGNVDGWWDLEWSSEAIHIVAQNQTKWWFAKRFLHPDIVSIYDYVFLWDEDLGVENFHPGRYLEIVREAGLEISQPALHPNSTDIHHRITIRSRKKKFHRRVYDIRGSVKCTEASQTPPCTGFVEGMAPVFSRAAWHCTWHLIQGDRTTKVGVVDSEYIVHKGIQTLGDGGLSARKVSNRGKTSKKRGASGFDVRTEIRRQSTREFSIFKERWNNAVDEDMNWTDPFKSSIRRRKQRKRHTHLSS
ncbi:uncharacterized protein Pyn_15374 [Prunus yedoensis var. nudiflora]|uniref:DUF707 domain-containing protein n=1 Tax=Prunus yedoensis var. nudiflora TaxID=2094558 RepID=A0A314YI07_PRUYE|nr:uncharacterized protein Pyn_15374 [Prunus yedoensis var. nudiflora]